MPAMRKFTIAAGLLFGLSLGACGGDKWDSALSEFEGIKNKMCECTDKACTDKVQDDYKAWKTAMKDKVGKDSKPSEAQDKKGRDLKDEMRACRKKFDGSGAGATE